MYIIQVHTSIMSSVHSSMMVAHSVEVIQIVLGEGDVGRLVTSRRLLPGWRPGPHIQVLHTLTSLDDMRGHVQASQGETHQSR